MAYPKEQISMLIMDTFKGQDNNNLRELCTKKDCEIVITPLNLTNKFQSLDISVNSVAKTYVSEKYNTWIANRISKQLEKSIAPTDVKVALLLSVIKPLHVKWIADLCHHLKADKGMIVNGFRAAKISETIKNAQNISLTKSKILSRMC